MLVDLIKAPHHEQIMLYLGFDGSIRLLKVTFLTDLNIPIQERRKQIPFL